MEIPRNLLFIRVFRPYSATRTANRVQSFGLGRDSQVSTLVPLPDREGNAGKDDEQQPQWRTLIQRKLVVEGRRDTKVTMTVMVYRDTVWVTTFDEPFFSEAILELAHVESLVGMLTWAGDQARSYQDGYAV